ncbi:flagellar hook-length control protein FliK [Caldimonas brevitalea]|uniref:Flagellar hook-length control protein FliK n=1 Tax=Caldimonas brevitalea TaxID=413882 RepID=A0A0G3BUH3_9BURK|nr:flagellar hook-length control protein FliK [Caldimonas brevitalea]AKJ31016.1 flagellar hook-length control protein FliK [Caldimonas brevitalea]
MLFTTHLLSPMPGSSNSTAPALGAGAGGPAGRGAAAPTAGFSNLLQQAREQNQQQTERARSTAQAEAKAAASNRSTPPAAAAAQRPALPGAAGEPDSLTNMSEAATPAPREGEPAASGGAERSEASEAARDTRETEHAPSGTDLSGLGWVPPEPKAGAGELTENLAGEAALDGASAELGKAADRATLDKATAALEADAPTQGAVESEEQPAFQAQLDAQLETQGLGGDASGTAEVTAPAANLQTATLLPGQLATTSLSNPVATPSAEAQASVAVPVQSPEFPEALANQISYLVRDGVQQAKLMLNPVEMGPVTVQIALQGQQAQVDFAASQASTRAALEASLAQLAASLQSAGFTLTGGGVSQQHQPSAQSDSHNGQQPSDGRTGTGATAGVAEPGARAATAPRRAAQGRLDLYA